MRKGLDPRMIKDGRRALAAAVAVIAPCVPAPLICALVAAAPAQGAPAAPSRLVVWAWERPEDLRFLPRDVAIAVQTGFVDLVGAGVVARGRRLPLLARPGQVQTAVVHVQIDRRTPLAWSPAQRALAAREVLRLAGAVATPRVQIDFEVALSHRRVLLDLLRDVRAGLAPGTQLSMTALASWCDGEAWLDTAPVDEVAPMLFRMGPGGQEIRARLSRGGDVSDRRCRQAVAISTDAPIGRAPPGRRVYLFSPRPWTAADFNLVRQEVQAWDAF